MAPDGQLALDLGPAPERPLPEQFEGCRVTWKPWQLLRMHICGPGRRGRTPLRPPCERCGDTDDPQTTTGIVHPAHGETVTTTTHYTRRSDRACEGPARQVPAWPLVRLFATRCQACGDVRVYDTGPDGAEWKEIR